MSGRQFADVHADWLRLVEPEGQFLTLPVLRKAFPSGLDSIKTIVRDGLRKHYPKSAKPSQEQWDAWIDWLLRDVLEWGPYYRIREEAATFFHVVPEYGLTLRSNGALVKDDIPRILMVRYPHGTALDERIKGDRWNTSPVDRVKELCKAQNVRLGLVTDGERISLVWVPPVGVGGHAIWDTSLFLESRERGLLQSFTSLLRASRFFSVQEDAQIESLFEASEKLQSEVTSQLGFQVRQAVELLVNAISKENLERGGKLLAGIPPKRVYEASATVMMRLVFLLYAEERDLLPLSEPLYADYYAISTLREQLDEQAAIEGDEPLERRGAAWNRLLAAFRVIYAGLNHDRLRLPAYGGRLFDPDRFPFLEGRTNKQKWYDSTSTPLFVDDLTVRAILEAIQTLPIREGGSAERRRLSFRSLDVEQIGHVYEGLLDHGAERVDDIYVGLIGKTGDEAEIPLADLEKAAQKGRKQLIALLADKTKRSESAIEKILASGQSVVQGKDADMRRLLNTACDNKRDLVARIAPFVYALRKDLHGLPVIFNAGSLVVKQTRARRDSGTEYTPRELAEEMVQYELEPLVYSPGPRDGVEPEEWSLRPSKELLGLKICDPAVGSGAFLVSACRYLADRVVEAWILEDHSLENANRDDLTLDARRAVVDRCLYGVDRDKMAVEMAKLSLWLITMARERPFSFLDHSIREGDSLLGITTVDQVVYLHMNPATGLAVHDGSIFNATALLKPLVERAADLRRTLESLPSVSVRDSEAKQKLNDEANQLLEQVSLIADAVVSVALSTATLTDKQRAAGYHNLAMLAREALDPSVAETIRSEIIDTLHVKSRQMLNDGRAATTPERTTLHWPIAFPEVFDGGRRGFDAIIGNPPFVGGQKITGNFGTDYRDYLIEHVGGGRRGSADLVAYFFLRAAQLADSIGFLAVNTIAQGDTREVGLEALTSGEWRITRAVKNRQWPGSAGVHIAQVWMSNHAEHQQAVLDNAPVESISSFLASAGRSHGTPFRLTENANLVFQGSIILGLGFTMTPEEAANLIKDDQSNADVLFPFINADDLLSRYDASPSRWVVNFFDWPIERARKYKTVFRIIEEKVKPERQRLRSDGSHQLRKPLPQKWWQYGEKRPKLYQMIAPLDRVIAMPFVSKYMIPYLVDARYVFAAPMQIFADSSYRLLGILSSSIHNNWARKYGSTLETRLRYSSSDCFETFPLPDPGDDDIERLTSVMSDRRHSIMTKYKIGLTEFYNQLHSPSVTGDEFAEVRQLHAEIDLAVVRAYGWTDIDIAFDFRVTPEGARWGMSETSKVEILDRLFELNHHRHAGESRAVTTKSGNGKFRRGKKAAPKSNDKQMALY